MEENVNDIGIAFESYIWRVKLSARGAGTKEMLLMTESAIPGADFSAIVKLHAREFARKNLVDEDAVSMTEMVLLGKAHGATKMTDKLEEPDLKRGPDGNVMLGDDFINRVSKFTEKFEHTSYTNVTTDPKFSPSGLSSDVHCNVCNKDITFLDARVKGDILECPTCHVAIGTEVAAAESTQS